MMNLLVVNPTSNKLLDNKIYDRAIYSAKITARNSEDHTNISVINLAEGPNDFAGSSLETIPELLLDMLSPITDVYDGIVVAHSSDIGVGFLQEKLSRNIVGTGFSGIYTALSLGSNIGFFVNAAELGVIKTTIGLYEKKFSCNIKFLPVDVNEGEDKMFFHMKMQADKALAAGTIDTFVIGDVNMSFAMKQLFAQYQLPVIDGIMSAVSVLENIVFNKKWLR
ncbi:hypothetical protein [Pectinatus sottacetonis]|uniref:hypothetical protein n=1 Tax=Pectinatus sottacetonis TaxID=1002795 RepID=UPI0018C5A6A9|nr:hypothetical protein [Pectinatus sottacetonis]